MTLIAAKHPITQALEVIAPLIGCNLTIRSPRDSEYQKYTSFPALDYVIVDTPNATYDSSKNSWRITQTIRLDYHIKETKNSCLNDIKGLEHIQEIQAATFSFGAKLRKLITLLVNPRAINPKVIKDSDVIYNRFQFKFEGFVVGVNHRKQGKDLLTGTTNVFLISFIDADKQFCCIDDPQKLRGLVKEGSTSDLLIQNL